MSEKDREKTIRWVLIDGRKVPAAEEPFGDILAREGGALWDKLDKEQAETWNAAIEACLAVMEENSGMFYDGDAERKMLALVAALKKPQGGG